MKTNEIVNDPAIKAAERRIQNLEKQKKRAKIKKAELSKLQKNAAANRPVAKVG